MQPSVFRWGVNALALASLVVIYLAFTSREFTEKLLFMNYTEFQSFKTIFISIILEAIPFVLLGVLVSSVIHVFVSEQTIRRIVPKNPILGVLFGSSMGLFFPLCECGMIPVVRRLIMKGMPVYIAVLFVLTGPIINPVVFTSTFMAFRSRPEMAYSRMGLALIIAVAIGLVLYKVIKSNPLRHHSSTVQYDQTGSSLGLDHEHYRKGNRLFATLSQAADDFFEMGKYLILGAMITALIQTTVSRETLIAIGQGEWSSHLFMMGFAFILSLCSTADAFVAASFTQTFTAGSLLTFLVFGPMLDIKNTLMMLAVFKTRFVLFLIGLITITVLAASVLFERLVLS